MASPRPQSRFWRWVRRGFRWCRIAVLFVVLAALVGAIWLNRVGVPDFLKERLVLELHQRGIDLQFTRMRFHWYRGLVADNVRLGRPSETNAMYLTATEAELSVDGRALLDRQVHVTGVGLRGGQLLVPVWGTNAAPRTLVVRDISGHVRFSEPDQWELVAFQAQSFGVKLRLGGSLANASALKDLKLGRREPARQRSAAAFWYDLIDKLEQSQFDEPALIEGAVHGDAKEPSSFRASINISSPHVVSPWGSGTNVNVSAQLLPARNSAFQADVKIQARDAVLPWVRARSLAIEAHVAPSFTRWIPTNAHVAVSVQQAQTRWGRAGNFKLSADFAPNPADESASLAHYTVRAQQVETPWIRSARLEIGSDAVLSSSNLWPSSARTRVQFAGGEMYAVRAAAGTVEATLQLPPLETMEFADTNVSWWARVDRIAAGLQVQLSDLHSQKLDLSQLAFAADWATPRLGVRNLKSSLYDGEINGQADLDVTSRRLAVTVATTVDPKRVQFLLDTNSQRWLGQFTWEKPPVIHGALEAVLPAWTNAAQPFFKADWQNDVLPTLQLSGDFEVGRGTFRALSAEGARSSFTLSNLLWRLPDLVVTRPEGRALIAHEGYISTHEFAFDIDSTIDPRALGPVLGKEEREVLGMFVFTNIPHVRCQGRGLTHSPEATSVYAMVSVTNLSFRNLPVREVRTVVTFTNQVLSFVRPVVVREEGTGRADSVTVDLHKGTVFINNATGSLDPAAVTHAVGPEVEGIMRPYHFVNAPVGRVHGIVDFNDVRGTDLHFELAGGPFEWMWFRFQQITGVVHWAGSSLTLSNVVGSLDGGQLEGGARFDFLPARGCDFSFRTRFADINLHSLIADLGTQTNKVEGALNGVLEITRANSEDMKSWQGSGNLAVNDGLLWDFPALGIFSPILNSIKEGAGNSRAKEAVATFQITNSIIATRDLRIHASGMRLKFTGTVDFDRRINGRMTALLFRDTPGIGGLMSTALFFVTKLFEYKVSGTLANPTASLLYIPDFMAHPFRSLLNLGPKKEGEDPARTQPPPK